MQADASAYVGVVVRSADSFEADAVRAVAVVARRVPHDHADGTGRALPEDESIRIVVDAFAGLKTLDARGGADDIPEVLVGLGDRIIDCNGTLNFRRKLGHRTPRLCQTRVRRYATLHGAASPRQDSSTFDVAAQ